MNNKGKFYEDVALKYLKKHRYKLVDYNFKSKFGEIDLIVKNRKYLCFVEVKQRDANDYATPAEYVDSSKQRKIISTAKLFLYAHPTELQPRFDVVEIYTENNSIKSIKHLENADE
ncbi:MAG: YraN family protein, partial [Clostridiales bacterium]|nr:YraN family protein [Clostridiales bacterium]